MPQYKNGHRSPGSENGYPGRPIAEIITNGFLTIDRKWTVIYWNKAAETILGIPAAEIVGHNLWEKFSGAFPADFYAIYHKAFLQRVPSHFKEYWGEMGAWFDVIAYPAEDSLSVSFKSSRYPIFAEPAPSASHSVQQLQAGTRLPAGHSAPPQFPSPKNPSGYTEYSGQSLKIMNAFYRFVTEVTDNCLWEWDLEKRALFWIDGGHKRVFGYDIENALVPQSFWESCLHPEDKPRILKDLNGIIAGHDNPTWQDDYRFRKIDGTYAHVHDRGHIIYDGNGRASRMIGATRDITEKVLLEFKLTQERKAREKEITEAVITAQEKERADIGKELHDNLNQILGATKLYIEIAKTDEENRKVYLEKSAGYIVQVIEEIRRISKVLATPVFKIMGLYESIKILLDDLIAIHPIKIEFRHEGIPEKTLDEKLQLTIFRIVQEQLNNILKHANAGRASIVLTKRANKIQLVISDDGGGCDLSEERQGVGLINIRSRAELCRGNVTLQSRRKEGFILKILFALTGPA
ncbi:MAG: PAS domain-containing protein [Puia sp.]|nr:PAS domain-containing protein [Puia sp.]